MRAAGVGQDLLNHLREFPQPALFRQPAFLGFFHRHGLGFTDLLPTREIPFVRKTRALRWLDLMNPARGAIEHDAFVVVFFDQRQALSIGAKSGVTCDEFLFC